MLGIRKYVNKKMFDIRVLYLTTAIGSNIYIPIDFYLNIHFVK